MNRNSSIPERSGSEREIYDGKGLDRSFYDKYLAHCQWHFLVRMTEDIQEHLIYAHGRSVLELGSNSWHLWLEQSNIRPRSICCINILRRELARGVASTRCYLKPFFSQMDAHFLGFKSGSFDLIFGGGILHHLDLNMLLDEMARILKPGGKIVFLEPSGINPVGKVVRFLTPRSRTPDEKPIGIKELNFIKEVFDIKLRGFQLTTVPVGFLTGIVMKRPQNVFLAMADAFDRLLNSALPQMIPLYRYILIFGNKRA